MKYWLCLLLLCCSALNATQPPPLKIAWGRHDIAPIAMIERGEITGGLIFDLGSALAKELNTSVEFVEIPRRRQANALLTGKVDVVLPTSPLWQKEANKFVWTKPLFEQKDVFVVSKVDPKKYLNLKSLYKLDVGAIRGYVYPSLADDFKAKNIARHDVSNINANFDKLKHGRIDGFIVSEWIAYYELDKNKYKDDLKLSGLIISRHDIYAAISPESPLSSEKINLAVEQLKHKQMFNEILNRYRPNVVQEDVNE